MNNFINIITTSNNVKAISKWIKFDSTIEIGMTLWGNFDFLIRCLSFTILGVVLVSDNEKKFQRRSPINKNK